MFLVTFLSRRQIFDELKEQEEGIYIAVLHFEMEAVVLARTERKKPYKESLAPLCI